MSDFEKNEKIEVVSSKEIFEDFPKSLDVTTKESIERNDSVLEKMDSSLLEKTSSKETVEDLPESLESNVEESLEHQDSALEKKESIFSFFEKTEIVSDTEMVEGIAKCLEKTKQFKFENWCKLSLKEREKLLNEVEQKIAAIEHRPPLKVELKPLKPHHMGYQSDAEKKIVLNSNIVGSNERSMHRQVLDTIIHEGRHAYQHYNVDVKTIHQSASEVASWRENFYSKEYGYYRSGTHYVPIFHNGHIKDADFRLYYYQPVEIDARNFAADVMKQLEAKGIV